MTLFDRPPAGLREAGVRLFGSYGVTGWDVEDVLEMRPDLTRDQAEAFLIQWDSRLVDRLSELGSEVIGTYLLIDDEIPAPPVAEVLERIREERDLLPPTPPEPPGRAPLGNSEVG